MKFRIQVEQNWQPFCLFVKNRLVNAREIIFMSTSSFPCQKLYDKYQKLKYESSTFRLVSVTVVYIKNILKGWNFKWRLASESTFSPWLFVEVIRFHSRLLSLLLRLIRSLPTMIPTCLDDIIINWAKTEYLYRPCCSSWVDTRGSPE